MIKKKKKKKKKNHGESRVVADNGKKKPFSPGTFKYLTNLCGTINFSKF